MNAISLSLITELARLDAKAAEGPWFIRPRPTDDGLSIIEDGREHGLFPITGETFEIELIVAMRNALPDLLASYEEMQRERDEARAVLEPLANELSCTLEQYDKIGPAYTHKDGTEVFEVSVLLDRRELIENAHAFIKKGVL